MDVLKQIDDVARQAKEALAKVKDSQELEQFLEFTGGHALVALDALLLLQGIAMILLSNSFTLPFTTIYLKFEPATRTLSQNLQEAGALRIGPAVAAFLLLTRWRRFRQSTSRMLPTPHLLLTMPQAPEENLVWPARRAISAKSAQTATAILCGVVTDGTGSLAKVPGYSVAGKTGTAQKVVNGRYVKGVYVSSFIGFLPAEDPRVLIVVVLDE